MDGDRPADRTRRRLVLAAMAVVLGLVAVCGGSVAFARLEIDRGVSALDSERALLHAPAAIARTSTQSRLNSSLTAARTSFGRARLVLWPWSPLLTRLHWVPVVGPRLAAAWPVADTAYWTADAAVDLDHGLTPLLARIRPGDARNIGVARMAGLLAQGHDPFTGALAAGSHARASAAGIPATGDPAVDGPVRRLRRDLPRLTTAARWLSLAPRLVGMMAPARYLFAWEDPMELRATGGFIGASDLITVRTGRLTHRFAGRVPTAYEDPNLLLPLPEAALTPETYWVFCDANWSPDFPTSARIERWIYGKDSGLWADGVVDFVDTGISSILRATGPVYVPAYGQRVDATNVTALAQQYINGTYKGPSRNGLRDTVRKQFFSHVMKALIGRIEHLPPARWPALLSALQTAIAHRDLLLFHVNPAVESAVRALRADGTLQRPHGDYLAVFDDNRSYNKINPYVRERMTHTARISPGGRVIETLSIAYRLLPSPRTLRGYGPGLGTLSRHPGYGPALGPIGSKHDYLDFLRVYVPRGAVLQSMSGLQSWAPLPAYGRMQFAGSLLLRSGNEAHVTIRYTVPADVLGSRGYHLLVQGQPGADLTALRLRVEAPGTVRARTIRRPQGDIAMSVSLPRVPAHPAAVVAGSSDRDPYLAYKSFPLPAPSS